MSKTYDIIIVGGGIVGCACARSCTRAGLKTLLVDRGPIGAGTTAAGMGHIVVLDESDAHVEMCSYSQRLWRELANEAGGMFQWLDSGTLWVAADDDEMNVVAAKYDTFASAGLDVEMVDAARLMQLEPNLRAGLAGGLRVKSDSVVYAPAAARYLADQAAKDGCEVRPHCEVVSILDHGEIVLADGTKCSGGVVVNATGYWSKELTPGIDVFMRKGHLAVTNRYPEFATHQMVELGYTRSAANMSEDSVAFNLHPRANGKYLIGSSRQSGVTDSRVEYALLGRMLKRAIEYMPGLADMWVQRSWTGFRPATTDKLPLIGPVEGKEKLWLATGHEGLGITTSLATGQMIADMAMQRKTEIDTKPFLPSRGIRQGVAK